MSKEWPPEMLALPPRKCKKCGIVKPITDFPRNRTSPGGVFETCMVCYKASRGSRSATNTDTRFTGRSEHVRATPTSVRALVQEPVKFPDTIEVVELKKLNQLPRTLCIERDHHNVMPMVRELQRMKHEIERIYTFKNSRTIRYYIFLKQPKEQETASVKPKRSKK